MSFEVSLKELLSFELKSFLGRFFINSTPKLSDHKNYLNLGCGSNIVSGYVNADFFCSFKPWKKNKRRIEWQLDLRYPLNCGDGVFDGIYSEHTLEHLYPGQVDALLRELNRVAKENAIIRISVPDIEKYVNFYNGSGNDIDFDKFQVKYDSGCSAIRNVTQNYFHVSVWDYSELEKSLKKAGFRDVKRMRCNESRDKFLEIDIDERSWESLYVEAIK